MVRSPGVIAVEIRNAQQRHCFLMLVSILLYTIHTTNINKVSKQIIKNLLKS